MVKPGNKGNFNVGSKRINRVRREEVRSALRILTSKPTGVKGVGRRRTQLLDDLRNKRRYWEVKEEAEDRKRWRRQFIS